MQDHVASAGSWHKMRGANPQYNSPDWVGLEDVLPCAESLLSLLSVLILMTLERASQLLKAVTSQ